DVTEPTMYEVVRRLDDVSRDLRALTSTLEERYVPRREYELRVGELEKDAGAQGAFRRQVAAGALVGLVLIVAQIILTLARTPGVGA
ncbi:MAG: hypothetical protein ABIR39_16590, partial [Nocardioides sp.]|uniref:hypothetical protein n=1 Tax=Nocardioides sp. TaxID=35761 RepID=UPI003264B81B